MMCCIIKRPVLPEGMAERSKRAGEKTESLETKKRRIAVYKLVTLMAGISFGIPVNKVQMQQ